MKGLNPGQPVVTAKELGRRFGERTILKGASFSLMPGDRVGVLGVNGVGKSTLMKILAGRDKEYGRPSAYREGSDRWICLAGAGSSTLIRAFARTWNTPLAKCARSRSLRRDSQTWEDPAVMEDEERMNALLAEQGDVQGQLEALDAMDPAALDNRIESAMAALGYRQGIAISRRFRGGNVAGCRSAKNFSPVPTCSSWTNRPNHLDADTVAWLETFLAGYSARASSWTHIAISSIALRVECSKSSTVRSAL